MDTSFSFLTSTMDDSVVSASEDPFNFNFSGDPSPPSQLFGTPTKKKKKPEGCRTPGPAAATATAEDLFNPIYSAPDDDSALFLTPRGPAAKKMKSSFSSRAPTPKMRSSALAGKEERKAATTTTREGSAQKKPVEVEPVKEQQLFSDIPAPASPEAPERKEASPNMMKAEMKETEAEGGSSNLKEMMEAEMKKMMTSLVSLQSHQEKGGEQLLANAAALQEEVSVYKEKLAGIKEDYLDRVNLALTCLTPTK